MDKISDIDDLEEFETVSASKLCMKLFLITGKIEYYCLYKDIEDGCRPYEIHTGHTEQQMILE